MSCLVSGATATVFWCQHRLEQCVRPGLRHDLRQIPWENRQSAAKLGAVLSVCLVIIMLVNTTVVRHIAADSQLVASHAVAKCSVSSFLG